MSETKEKKEVKKPKTDNYLDETESSGTKGSVMISYARKDKAFVKNLFDALSIEEGRKIWIDWEDIPPSSEWLDEIHKGIEQSDAFLFVLSPDSIHSDVCNWEVDHAVKNGKRIIPVVCRDVDYRDVRKELASLNWIFFRAEGDDFHNAVKLLEKALDSDLRHACIHTKILTRAIEWERHDFEKSLLFKGKDLQRAKHWLSASALGKEPKPTTLHLSFITASDHLTESMKKRKLIAVFFAFIVAIGIIWPSWGVFFFSLVFSHFFVYFSSN
eukprot:TRINITY_DN23_c0_g1_i1.p1 TRINITY_DN23_c0_g1~~TRINITY_DN23_c0_g1_i1.p1  ORF type:complete len:271 (-),score=50.90 TRINITY_DN23_c0_g1_i1:1588-2400(-)